MKPNKEAMSKWVTELFYGDRKQTQGALTLIKDGQHFYCCLGVACEIFSEQVKKTEVVPRSLFDDNIKIEYDSHVSYDGYTSFLPLSIRKHFGIDGDVEILHEGKVMSAIHANDELKLSFKQIAQGINDYYKLDLELV